MGGTWALIRVDMLSGLGTKLDPPPGRLILVGPSHTFADLSEAIEFAFGRWDRSHLHEFTLDNGVTLGVEDEDAPEDQVDDREVKLLSQVGEGDEFTYVFDFGDDWTHQCRVERVGVDPMNVYGARPRSPVPVFGWGTLPDQYGRTTPEG